MKEMIKDNIRCWIENGQLLLDVVDGPGSGRPMPVSGDVVRILDLIRGDDVYRVKFERSNGEPAEEMLLAIGARGVSMAS